MEVTKTELRRDPVPALVEAQHGGEVIITDRGLPIAKLVPADGMSRLAALRASGEARAPLKRKGSTPLGGGRSDVAVATTASEAIGRLETLLKGQPISEATRARIERLLS